jgi:hypothetical protein
MASQDASQPKDGSTISGQEALMRVAREVDKIFVIPASTDSLLAPIKALVPKEPLPIAQSAAAFCSNVQSIVVMAGLPYTFALEAACRRRHQLLECAAELEAAIERDKRGAELPSTSVLAPHVDVERRLKELGESRSGRDALNHEACQFLLEFAKTDELSEAAAQLVLQAAVLTWGAFEVLSRDIFRAYLNYTPKAYARLLADADVRKRFDLSRVSIERLADFGFDLSCNLGDLLVEQNDLADLGGIKTTFVALFSSDSFLREALGERDLWLLFQRRSLIVHRRGIIDQRYIELSGDQQPIGSRLIIRPRELKRYLELVTKAASALISAARTNS